MLKGCCERARKRTFPKGTDNTTERFRFEAIEDVGIRVEVGQMQGLNKKPVRHRGKINMQHPHEVKCWSHQLRITKEQLQGLVDKVGNTAAAVRKELEHAKGNSAT
jgi:Protein of unknown function (DUF3606)